MPVIEDKNVRVFFPYLTKTRGEHNKTIELLRKGKDWYVAIPIQVSFLN